MPDPSLSCLIPSPSVPLASSLSVIPPAIIAAVLAVVGNYCIQVWVQQRAHAVEELKKQLYFYLELTLKYWMDENADEPEQGRLEIQMIAKHSIITSEFYNLSKICARFRFIRRDRWKNFMQADQMRRDLWHTATGGCFQQREGWKVDPARAMDTAKIVSKIVESIS